MITRIVNGICYSPEPLGQTNLLVAGRQIAALGEQAELEGSIVQTVDASDCYVVPGLVDSLAHIIGGGGEGGFRSRTSELKVTDAIEAGVTTLVGVLGTDAVTRTLTNLLAKAHALDEEGLTCYCHTGSYQVPAYTLMGDLLQDLVLIDKFIGVGEVAIADHRSSQPTVQELARLASQARVGGMLSGKAGIVSVHVGPSPEGITQLLQVASTTDIPITQFYPTHMNRNQALLQMGFDYVSQGGYIDLTTSTTAQDLAQGEIKCADALLQAVQAGVNLQQVTFSSDANASLPMFDAQNNFVGLGEGRIASLYEEMTDAIRLGVPVQDALRVVTSNPARILKLPHKGQLQVGADADLLLIDKNTLELKAVMAKGRWLFSDGRVAVQRSSLFF
ncbi:beta-aspartyl-peptidase [Rheinheimera sp. MM224]|uniref:beta-aspartyl-peptidase n=1 Tax=Rheinheimera sp. MM224 TaxID=3019969 RepID=UPI0021F90C80|nr:beta-aspartyl-peptidase [Rheinheimera sp. MM224]CAI3804959.1 Isoaspartyl dipeptidase [Rheinheimera sp. MM224]